ncbi:hypothetical protein [Streptomyces sp. A0592]|uniref:hypothetical protein n=1 Tax=Streptomyces sp. A0592 TaxID=2563099 RepID=UPI00109E9694|nr:hypothetical protein [Streptomyces sp. A0592]THA82722.1 hypothetical protein E6U81_19450 [Streptomyces sp. A0592]
MTGARAGKAQSWEDFKAQEFGVRTEIIQGVEVQVPDDVPLGFKRMAGHLSSESDVEDFAPVVALLYGDGVFDQWVDNGMGANGLLVAIMWGYLQGSGRDVTFSEAYEVANSPDPGKAAAAVTGNRAARRSQSRATGGRSSRTSAASTASGRKTSRT